MKVVQIFDQTSPFVSGYSMRSRYITDSLAQLGVGLHVFSSPIFSYENKEEAIDNVAYSRCEFDGFGWMKRIPLLKEKAIIHSIKKTLDKHWQPDFKIIDAHSSVLNGIAASQSARKYNVPFVYEIRALWEDAAVDQAKTKEGSLRYNFTRFLETDVIKKADKVTVICEGLKKDIMARGIDEKKIVVIPNGVDIDNFQPSAIPDRDIQMQYDLKDCRVFGFIGTFFHFEGLELLVRAFKEMLSRRKDIKLLLVGGGREERNLKQLVHNLGVSEHVVFTGRVKHGDVKRYYSVIDVLVYPRLSKRITELVTPLKPLEAMALQKIVVASNVGGLQELIKDGRNGILFEKENIDDLTEKCLAVLNNFSRMKEMAEQARAYVKEKRNWINICKAYLDIYRELGEVYEDN